MSPWTYFFDLTDIWIYQTLSYAGQGDSNISHSPIIIIFLRMVSRGSRGVLILKSFLGVLRAVLYILLRIKTSVRLHVKVITKENFGKNDLLYEENYF